jgi:glycosyltransferase involved in cell wall biosynthesis
MLRANDRVIERVWLDVSLLLICNPSQSAGISRTVANLFRGWWARGFSNLHLCTLDMEQQGYVAVAPGEVLARFPMHPTGQAGGAADLAVPAPPSPWARASGLARRSLRRCLPRPARAALRAVVSRRPKQPPRPLLRLTPRDLVLTPGAGWLRKGGASLSRQLEAQMGFRAAYLFYDLIPVKLPQFFVAELTADFRADLEETLRHVHLGLAISRHTRRDLEEYGRANGLPVPPIEVIRLGEEIPPPTTAGVPLPPDVLPPGAPFALSVGTLEIRKNHYLLYHVWRRLAEHLGPEAPRLLLVGTRGWLIDEVLYQIGTDPLTKGLIIHVPHCRDAQLPWLYRRCLFTLYPSHYEGWGLPVAESLAYGKLCVCSNSSSLPEIAPGLVEMHDPLDVAGCLRLVRQALDPAYRAAREERIRREFRPTSWDDTAQQIIDHLERHFGPAFLRPAA